MAIETVTFRDPSGFRWRVVDSWRERLFPEDVFLPDAPTICRDVLKQTGSRLVEAVTLASGERVFVKRYPYRPGLEGLKRLLPLSGARTEWQNGRILQDLGLPCAAPIAYGRAGGADGEPAAEVLVTGWIDDSLDLADLWKPGVLPPDARRALIESVARLVRGLHDGGVAHEDPHLRNFLARRAGAGWTVVPIDLRRLKTGPRLGISARDANLSLLYQTMGIVASKAQRLRFLTAYLEGGEEMGRRARALRLEQQGERRVRRYRRDRSADALGSNPPFELYEAGGIRWHVRTELRDGGLEAVLADPESAFDAPDEILKQGRSAQVIVKHGWVVKRFCAKRRRRLVLDRVLKGRAVRALQSAFLLELSGVPTPRAAAAGKRVEGGVVRCSYLVTQRVTGARHIDVAMVEAAPEARAALIQATGALIGALHAHGVANRDLKAANIVVGGDGKPWVVDLDGISLRGTVAAPRAAYDLARLFRDLRARAGVTSLEERDLVGAYACAARLDAADVSPLLASIERTPRLRAGRRADVTD